MEMLNVAFAQLNFTVGDIEGNKKKIIQTIEKYKTEANVILFPELSLSGYPPEDLLLQPHFWDACRDALKEIVRKTRGSDTLVCVGTPYYELDLYNALVLIHDGQVVGVYKKHFLPNYGVFDECRYFRRGEEEFLVKLNDYLISFSICEDIWYPDGVERRGALSGAHLILNTNASPYHAGKYEFKERFLRARAQDNLCFVGYLNLVGAQDELVFDGRSLVIAPDGELVARAKAFEEDVLVVSLELEDVRRKRALDLRWREASSQTRPLRIITSILSEKRPLRGGRIEESPKGEEELYTALVLGLRDYAKKNNFPGAVLGLSGGIDSSLVACIASDALGSENVLGVFMPSEFSSKESYEDAKALAKALGIRFLVVPIDEVFKTFRKELTKTLEKSEFTLADENIQARIRANILFYISNELGYLVLSTSNKSESAVGYTTIYGDMSGGFAPIKDVYKTLVYKLARYRNKKSPVIPERVFKKPPSAELRPNQRDQDTLPPYELLDKILRLYVEENLSPEEIVSRGFPKDVVYRTVALIRKSEYKRKQAPVGTKVTKRAFGKDWRMPITNRFLL
ncbi:MAG: NAD+ synthase [Aquificae bacterium]|nr:NAD+ synthase [Aquificota bacterium]